jgi:mannosyltransferase
VQRRPMISANKIAPVELPREEFALFSSQKRYHRRVLLALACLASFRLWFLPLTSSFWLDELVTYWSAYKGVMASIARSQFWPGQNMAYTMLAAAMMRIGGPSELALRLPSVFATLLTAWLLFRLGEHFLDREAGILVVVVFACLHPIASEAAANARPYGIALMLAVASVLQLVRWLQARRLRNMFGFVLTAAAIPYFHLLFATMYLVLLAYGIYVWRSERRIRARELMFAPLLIAILLSPLAWNFLFVHRTSSDSSFARIPDTRTLLVSFIPQVLAASLFLGVLAGWLVRRKTETIVAEMPRSAKFLLAAWLTIPVVVLFLVTRLSPLKVFIPRYYLPAFAALALIVGCGIRLLAPPRMRMIIAIFLVMGSTATSGHHLASSPHQEDWRAAAELVRGADILPTTPVLIRVGLIETAKIHWDIDLDRDSPLLCPIAKYPMPGRIILLPHHLDSESTRYLQEISVHIIKPVDKFVMVTRSDDDAYIAWAQGWFLSLGFEGSELGDSKGVPVFLFRRIRTSQVPAQAGE